MGEVQPAWKSLGGHGISRTEGFPENDRRLWADECLDDMNKVAELEAALREAQERLVFRMEDNRHHPQYIRGLSYAHTMLRTLSARADAALTQPTGKADAAQAEQGGVA